MNIREISANNASTGTLLEKVLVYSPILDKHVEFFTGAGDGTTQRKEQGGLEISEREPDNAYTSKILKPDYFPVGRKIFGESIKVDVVREDWGSDIASEFESQFSRIAPGVANKFHNLLINGDATANPLQFNGIKKMVGTTQTVSAGTNGLTVLVGKSDAATESQETFLELIDEAIGACKGINKVIILGAKAHARLTTIARPYLTWTETTFGKKLAQYNGTTLLNIEEGGASIIPATETQGTLSGCSSIYIASFEERAGLSFFTSQNGFRVHEMLRVSNHFEKMVDFTVDSALFRDSAIARLKGVKF